MRRTIATIAITAYAIATLSISAAALTAYDRQELSHVNALADQNPGFESGAVKWSCSPALTINSNAASQFVPGSKQFATWDSNASAQECCSSLVKVPESGNCAASLTYKVPSGTATHKIVAKDGSKDLAVEDVFSSTAAWRHDVEFPCAAAASNQARVCLRSVASNEPAIQLDGGYAGEARTVGLADGASYIGALATTGTWNTNVSYVGTYWKLPGGFLHGRVKITITGAPNNTSLAVNLPTGYTTNFTRLNQVAAGTGSVGGGTIYDASPSTYYDASVAADTSNSRVYVYASSASASFSIKSNPNQTNPITFASGDSVDFSYTIPVNEFSSSTIVTPERQRTPKVTVYTSGSGTFTPSNGATYMHVMVVGGGGGGSGSGNASAGAGGNGGNSTFGSSLLTASGGTGSDASGSGGAGGGTTINSPAVTILNVTGGDGGTRLASSTSINFYLPFAYGGANPLGGAGIGGAGAGGNARLNTGGGGAGGRADAGGANHSGGGGGAGGYIEALISNPSGSYSYAVGAGGSAGSAGTSGSGGGAGAAGRIVVTEYFGYGTALLANSVSTARQSGDRILSGTFNCDGSSQVVRTNEPGTTTIGNITSGACSVSYAAFPVAPDACTPVLQTCAAPSGSGCFVRVSTAASASGLTVRCYSDTGADCTSHDFYMICTGPR